MPAINMIEEEEATGMVGDIYAQIKEHVRHRLRPEHVGLVCAAFAEPSYGLESETCSFPSPATGGNPRQRFLACFCRFRANLICDRLLPVATNGVP
jgi:hypothetical protein